MRRKPVAAAVEFLPRRFFFVALHETERLYLRNTRASEQPAPTSTPSASRLAPSAPRGVHFVSLDDYFAQAAFSPRSDRSETVRFYDFLVRFLADSSRIPSSEHSPDARAADATAVPTGSSASGPCASVYYFYLRHASVECDAHVIHLICQWRLMHLRLSPQEAVAPFEHIAPLFPAMLLTPQRGVASAAPPLLNLLQSLAGVAKGLAAELLGAGSSVDVLRHVAEQQRALDDANVGVNAMWVTKHLVVLHEHLESDEVTSEDAGLAESATRRASAMAARLAPLLKQQHVALLIQVEKHKSADSGRDALGIEAVDLTTEATETESALDTSTALARFLDVCEGASGVTAVLSQHGSAQAAAFVGCYLMKHAQLTSREAFAWTHWCCVNNVTLRHQLFLDRMQTRMWRDGDAFRRQAAEANAASDTAMLTGSDAVMHSSNSLQISIGNMSLTRHSLFGRKGDKQQQQHGTAPTTARVQSCTSRGLQGSSTSGPSTPQLQSPPQQQVKRRPLTQGSAARRPRGQSHYRNGEGGGVLRADFAQMHKFLHQTGSTGSIPAATTPRGASVSESLLTPSSVSSAEALPPVHASETLR